MRNGDNPRYASASPTVVQSILGYHGWRPQPHAYRRQDIDMTTSIPALGHSKHRRPHQRQFRALCAWHTSEGGGSGPYRQKVAAGTISSTGETTGAVNGARDESKYEVARYTELDTSMQTGLQRAVQNEDNFVRAPLSR